ncbi:MAG: MBL fold metallo-hydrolase [Proteobacteria bacterium]|nr:MBL fold metallo-hydrolase [Pseudomonadota bacterium]
MQITDTIWQVGGDSMTAPGDAAIYLVAFDDKAALIDAGCGRGHGKLIQNISRYVPAETKIEYLFLTHCHFDHVGGAEAIRGHFGCKIVAHERDAEYLESGDSMVTAARWYNAYLEPLPVDYKMSAAEEAFRIGNGEIRALHCPGHSPGSLVCVTEVQGKKILFGQDVHGPLHPELLSNRTDYIHSLKFLLSLEADILCEGHCGVYKGKKEVRDFIGSFIR